MLYDSYSPERLMWASDWPLITISEPGGYRSALELIRAHIDFLNANDREWLLNKSTSRIWRFS
jgi:predicted TIM-barrel fold metal-dependent hydrolase